MSAASDRSGNVSPLQLQVPLDKQGKFDGVILGEYSLDGLLRFGVPPEVSARYAVALIDDQGQILAGSQMSLGLIKSSLQGSSLEYYTHCRNNLSLASTEIRNLSHRLAPVFFDDKKLEEAFLSLINTFNIDKRYTIQVHIAQGINEQLMKMGRDIQLNLYRILQEQLRNILKYAQATEIDISVIHYNNRLLMTVADNGVGFDVQVAKRGIGLQNIKRRAELFLGSMEIISSPGNGCELVVRLPISGGEENTVNQEALPA
jgi:signal transduction histidine kinase